MCIFKSSRPQCWSSCNKPRKFSNVPFVGTFALMLLHGDAVEASTSRQLPRFGARELMRQCRGVLWVTWRCISLLTFNRVEYLFGCHIFFWFPEAFPWHMQLWWAHKVPRSQVGVSIQETNVAGSIPLVQRRGSCRWVGSEVQSQA